jgi:succinate-semialdehyde dehydrogenase/glutarate-semialdehyde dehydrogenase
VASDAAQSFVRFDPLGPVLAVMPWNFPLWQVFRFIAPALTAGNVGLLKHASNVPGCALAIEGVLRQAGFPEGAFQTLLIGSAPVSGIIADPRVAAVTLTGSEPAGRAVGRAAGDAIKPSVLELGGSDPLIVLADADLDHAVAGAVLGRMINSGQSCIAAKRFIVEGAVYDAFVQRLTAALGALKVGDPRSDDTDIGPLARPEFVAEIHDQVRRSIAQGARCVLGGEAPEGPGCFYPPTLLADVTDAMAAFREETFGPVAVAIRASDADHAIALANDSEFGLGASIWTDMARGISLAPRIDAGHVAINGIVKSDPRLPFGGVKRSGYGRELARYGQQAFMNVKAVWAGPA